MRSSPPPTPAFVSAFLAKAGPGATLSFADFMALALYDPQVGYYRQSRERVGRGASTDFYTASSSGRIFGELVAAAVIELLGRAQLDPAAHRFVEIGAEPGRGVLDGVAHPFASTQTLRVGEPLALNGRCIVFSNELFDAQPIRRFVRHDGGWRELGVAWDGVDFKDVLLDAVVAPWLPASAPDGYAFDAPRAAAELTHALARQPWSGLFIAFDYGKSFSELATSTPQGTVRAYFRHQQSNALLAQPGEQDLTGHVCWDWLVESLSTHGFAAPEVQSQESFFITHAAEFLARTLADEATRLSQRKLALMQLLHPANMGQKFQVLHATRGEA